MSEQRERRYPYEPKAPAVLAVDVGGSHVKTVLNGIDERRRFVSGPKMTAQQMVDGVLEMTKDLDYTHVSVGCPAPIKDDKGQSIRLGSVLSGGRYDGLVERFTGEKVPATGISIGVSRLLFGLQRLGKYKESAAQGPVIVVVLDRDRIADYQKMAQALRAADIRAELYLGEGGMKAQMKYADKRGSPCVVIQGGDEQAKGEVQIKDLILGATLSSIENREEYLKKQAEAQFAVKEADLVKEVRRVLARHKS